ncbi:ClpP/crotonase-like domain-containing protein [Paraphoma chrysanthemicola]|uniref:ClpP/crotonase-like domain-containing protein n=1 Tax=Paraphoma chrysanthemicola TaxID=798071 RepID=A0A8K0QUL6_9PLEO|nr:ClpP/crotonase-like domain-containing protein [Paraphoma chrysanthemicola]
MRSMITFALHLIVGRSVARLTVGTSCINDACSAARLTISNPPVNLFDKNVISDLNESLIELTGDNQTKVVVVSSDVPGFFGAQIDLNILGSTAPPGVNASAVLETYYDNLNLLLSSSIIFIAEVNGRAWGAGDEHILRMDMRFAGPEAQFGAPEAAVGLIHVGGLQQLTRLIGPGLASEYMLSAAQVKATEAARIGWVNSAYPSPEALRNHVNKLATRIALFSFEALNLTKQSIAEQGPTQQALRRDRARFEALAMVPVVGQRLANIVEISKNQSTEWELNNNNNIVANLY